MYKELDEQALAGYCAKGDIKAEDELYRRYAARVYTLCRRYCGDVKEAEDLMQDALIQALDKIRTFNYTGRGSLYAWIRKIAVNKAINHIRRHRWRMVPLDHLEEDTTDDLSADEMESVPQEKLMELISRLPEARRAVLNLYCIDGYSHKKIGQMLGISEKGSAGILAKARKQLKEAIKIYLKNPEK
ncbi:MAG: sigma-70 family RNA polymerase sigma factor [Spirochaetia bacterium]|nr:sigma-70 family RNA polymerase sigma factor [Spirochaetia bacterium]